LKALTRKSFQFEAADAYFSGLSFTSKYVFDEEVILKTLERYVLENASYKEVGEEVGWKEIVGAFVRITAPIEGVAVGSAEGKEVGFIEGKPLEIHTYTYLYRRI
jgi:hypothetical protein